MKLNVRHVWLKAAVKEARRRANATISHLDAYELSADGRKTRELAEAILRGLENL